jgi:hypothetical protein
MTTAWPVLVDVSTNVLTSKVVDTTLLVIVFVPCCGIDSAKVVL